MQRSTLISLSLVVLSLASAAMVANFNMLAGSLSKLVGARESMSGFQLSDVAALVMVLTELSMGLFLLAALQKIHLFPVIAALPHSMRLGMAWIAGVLLLAYSMIGAGLIYIEEVLLSGDVTATADGAVVAKMAIAFPLPFTSLLIVFALNSLIGTPRGGSTPNQQVPPGSARQ